MRTIKLSNGREYQVKPLNCKTVREMRAAHNEGLDDVLATVEAAGFKLEEFDDLPFPDMLALSRGIISETYGVEVEEKN